MWKIGKKEEKKMGGGKGKAWYRWAVSSRNIRPIDEEIKVGR